MASEMTLEQVRDALYAIHDEERPMPMRKEAREWAAVIGAHLTSDEKPMLWRVVADPELHDVLNEDERDVVYWSERDLPTGDDAEGFTIIPLYTRAHLAQPAQAVDVDYVPGELDRTAPERVWLQIDTSASNNVRNEVWPGADGVTWQDESIGGLEIQYVRADLVPRALCGEKAGPVGDGKYRLLGPGDVIEPDDEFIADNAVDWVPLKANPGTAQLFAGMQYRLGTLKQARRPLPASPTPDKEGQP